MLINVSTTVLVHDNSFSAGTYIYYTYAAAMQQSMRWVALLYYVAPQLCQSVVQNAFTQN